MCSNDIAICDCYCSIAASIALLLLLYCFAIYYCSISSDEASALLLLLFCCLLLLLLLVLVLLSAIATATAINTDSSIQHQHTTHTKFLQQMVLRSTRVAESAPAEKHYFALHSPWSEGLSVATILSLISITIQIKRLSVATTRRCSYNLCSNDIAICDCYCSIAASIALLLRYLLLLYF